MRFRSCGTGCYNFSRFIAALLQPPPQKLPEPMSKPHKQMPAFRYDAAEKRQKVTR
jgi:hypothetical protein